MPLPRPGRGLRRDWSRYRRDGRRPWRRADAQSHGVEVGALAARGQPRDHQPPEKPPGRLVETEEHAAAGCSKRGSSRVPSLVPMKPGRGNRRTGVSVGAELATHLTFRVCVRSMSSRPEPSCRGQTQRECRVPRRTCSRVVPPHCGQSRPQPAVGQQATERQSRTTTSTHSRQTWADPQGGSWPVGVSAVAPGLATALAGTYSMISPHRGMQKNGRTSRDRRPFPGGASTG